MSGLPKYCEHPACKGATFMRPIGSDARMCPKHDQVIKFPPLVKVTPAQQWAKIASELIH